MQGCGELAAPMGSSAIAQPALQLARQTGSAACFAHLKAKSACSLCAPVNPVLRKPASPPGINFVCIYIPYEFTYHLVIHCTVPAT